MKKLIHFLPLPLLLALSNTPSQAQTHNEGEILTAGFNHIGLTVSDLAASSQFFTGTLSWKLQGQDPKYPAHFLSDGNMLITLWQIKDQENVVEFDRKQNVGLHHLALSVKSAEALYMLHDKFTKVSSVAIEFPPELAYGGPTLHMMIREPSGNRIEFSFRPDS